MTVGRVKVSKQDDLSLPGAEREPDYGGSFGERITAKALYGLKASVEAEPHAPIGHSANAGRKLKP